MQQAMGSRIAWITIPLILGGLMFATLERVEAVEVIDQSQELNNQNTHPTEPLQQTFRPALGNVSAVAVWIRGPGTVNIQLLDAVCGTVLGSGTASTTLAESWAKVSLAPAVVVTPETEYAFHVTGVFYSIAISSLNPYPRGICNLNCTPMVGDYDLKFRTYSDDTLVPVAPHVWGGVKNLYR